MKRSEGTATTGNGGAAISINSLWKVFGKNPERAIDPNLAGTSKEEVLVRYEKTPYTDSMAKKARNLALNYFMDYLTEYGMKLYKTRFNSVPEGNDNPEAHGRRHSAIRANCSNVVEEWGTRVGLSSHALFNVKARFMETADLFLKDQVGIDPVEMEQEAAN